MKKILFICFIFLFQLHSFSQSEEFGMFLGGSYYIGDLNPTKHFDLKNTNPAIGLLYKRNHYNKRYAFRLQFTYGKVEAYDYQSDDAWRANRNLNFSSTILEIGAIMEVNFFKYEAGNIRKYYQTPFLFFGIAGYNFKPMGTYKDKQYDLQALGTEGQNTSENSTGYYKLNQLAIPIGIGYKVNLNSNFAFSLEYGARILFTDYLDDVSGKYIDPSVLADESGILTPLLADQSLQQVGNRNIGHNRGNSALKDWYFFAGFSLTYSFNKGTECTNVFKRRK